MAQLTGLRIASRALAILDEEGLAGFSMRSIARALGVTPMALYHHVPNKAALAALMIEAAQVDHPFPEPAEGWQENLWRIAVWMRRSALAHPALPELRRIYDVWTPDFHMLADRWMTSWQKSGLDLDRAVLAATTSSAAISGLVADEVGSRKRRYVPSNPELPSMPNADLLLGTAGDPEQMFELAVHAIIEGLHARLLREQEVPSLPAAPRRRSDAGSKRAGRATKIAG